MTFLLKLHTAGRLSGDDRRRPVLSFDSRAEALAVALDALRFIAERAPAAHGIKVPRFLITDTAGRAVFQARLESRRRPGCVHYNAAGRDFSSGLNRRIHLTTLED